MPKAPNVGLARRLTAFDATLIVMGGVVGAGIFVNPSVVAALARTTPAIAGAWVFGGVIALIGAFVFAELARRQPNGGLYGYLRDAYHPVVAFSYGWTALLVSQSGGMAAAAITFGKYLAPVTPGHFNETFWGIAAIVVLSAINALGVRDGGNVQDALMLLRAAAIVALIVLGAFVAPAWHGPAHTVALPALPAIPLPVILAGFAAAMIQVLYAYDGFQTAGFVDGELKNPRRTLPLGLIFGMILVVALYLGVTAVGLRVLGASGLAATTTPALEIARLAIGNVGATFVALTVAVSTLGFLSNQVLTSPRIYYAMARDGTFFSAVARVHPKTRAPIVAIVLQGAVAIVIAALGRYDQILNYVVAMDFVFFALAGAALTRLPKPPGERGGGVPGHPWTTGFFVAISVAVVIESFIAGPREAIIGVLILGSAVPAYLAWRRWGKPMASKDGPVAGSG